MSYLPTPPYPPLRRSPGYNNPSSTRRPPSQSSPVYVYPCAGHSSLPPDPIGRCTNRVLRPGDFCYLHTAQGTEPFMREWEEDARVRETRFNFPAASTANMEQQPQPHLRAAGLAPTRSMRERVGGGGRRGGGNEMEGRNYMAWDQSGTYERKLEQVQRRRVLEEMMRERELRELEKKAFHIRLEKEKDIENSLRLERERSERGRLERDRLERERLERERIKMETAARDVDRMETLRSARLEEATRKKKLAEEMLRLAQMEEERERERLMKARMAEEISLQSEMDRDEDSWEEVERQREIEIERKEREVEEKIRKMNASMKRGDSKRKVDEKEAKRRKEVAEIEVKREKERLRKEQERMAAQERSRSRSAGKHPHLDKMGEHVHDWSRYFHHDSDHSNQEPAHNPERPPPPKSFPSGSFKIKIPPTTPPASSGGFGFGASHQMPRRSSRRNSSPRLSTSHNPALHEQHASTRPPTPRHSRNPSPQPPPAPRPRSQPPPQTQPFSTEGGDRLVPNSGESFDQWIVRYIAYLSRPLSNQTNPAFNTIPWPIEDSFIAPLLISPQSVTNVAVVQFLERAKRLLDEDNFKLLLKRILLTFHEDKTKWLVEKLGNGVEEEKEMIREKLRIVVRIAMGFKNGESFV